MPESDTNYLDYYPPGWTEKIRSNYIKWVFDEDPTIFVQLSQTKNGDGYLVEPTTGVNTDGEPLSLKPIWGLSIEEAFDLACTLIYAMNGTAGRLNGDPEFTGDK